MWHPWRPLDCYPQQRESICRIGRKILEENPDWLGSNQRLIPAAIMILRGKEAFDRSGLISWPSFGVKMGPVPWEQERCTLRLIKKGIMGLSIWISKGYSLPWSWHRTRSLEEIHEDYLVLGKSGLCLPISWMESLDVCPTNLFPLVWIP